MDDTINGVICSRHHALLVPKDRDIRRIRDVSWMKTIFWDIREASFFTWRISSQVVLKCFVERTVTVILFVGIEVVKLLMDGEDQGAA